MQGVTELQAVLQVLLAAINDSEVRFRFVSERV